MGNKSPPQKYPLIVGGIDKIAANFFWLLPTFALLAAGWWLAVLYSQYMIGQGQDPKKFYELVTTFTASISASLIAYAGLVYTVRSIKQNTNSQNEGTRIALEGLATNEKYAEAMVRAAAMMESRHAHSKQATTIKFILDINQDKRLQETKNKLFQHVDKGEQLTTTFEKCDDSARDEYHYTLNKYEFFALGIRQQVLNEELCKDLHCSNFIKLGKHAKPLIESMRIKAGLPCLYQEILWLLKRWEESPIAKH